LLLETRAYTITVAATKKNCFFDDFKKNDKFLVTYQVSDGATFDIDFWINDPNNRVILSAAKEPTGTYQVDVETDGRYTYCFSNQMSHEEKTISFNIHPLRHHVEEDDHMDPLDDEIEDLIDTIAAIKDEQEYIVMRERQHRDTAESTNARVMWWAILQIAILIASAVIQVTYLQRFFEVKRVV
jgi:hypothetical protein